VHNSPKLQNTLTQFTSQQEEAAREASREAEKARLAALEAEAARVAAEKAARIATGAGEWTQGSQLLDIDEDIWWRNEYWGIENRTKCQELCVNLGIEICAAVTWFDYEEAEGRKKNCFLYDKKQKATWTAAECPRTKYGRTVTTCSHKLIFPGEVQVATKEVEVSRKAAEEAKAAEVAAKKKADLAAENAKAAVSIAKAVTQVAISTGQARLDEPVSDEPVSVDEPVSGHKNDNKDHVIEINPTNTGLVTKIVLVSIALTVAVGAVVVFFFSIRTKANVPSTSRQKKSKKSMGEMSESKQAPVEKPSREEDRKFTESSKATGEGCTHFCFLENWFVMLAVGGAVLTLLLVLCFYLKNRRTPQEKE
jgi:hypothetical protein